MKRVMRQVMDSRTVFSYLVGVLMIITLLIGYMMTNKETELSSINAKEIIPLNLIQQGYNLERVSDIKYENKSFYSYQLTLNNDLLNYYILVDKELNQTFLISDGKKIDFNNIIPNYVAWEGVYSKEYSETEIVDNCFSNLIITNENGKMKLNFDSYYGRGQVKFETLLDLKDRYTTESYYFDTGDSFYLEYLNENEISITIRTVKDVITNETIDINEEYSENIIEDLTLRREEEQLMFSGVFYKR